MASGASTWMIWTLSCGGMWCPDEWRDGQEDRGRPVGGSLERGRPPVPAAIPYQGDGRGCHPRSKRPGRTSQDGIPEPIEPISYRELAERYLAQYDARSKRWFMDMLRPSVARFGSTSLLSLRPDEIAVWLAGLPHAASTNEKRLDVMRQVLKMGVEWVTCRGTLPARRPSRGQPPSQPMFVRSGHGTRCSPSPAFSAHIAQPQSSQRPPARAPKNGSHWNQRTYPRTLGRG